MVDSQASLQIERAKKHKTANKEQLKSQKRCIREGVE